MGNLPQLFRGQTIGGVVDHSRKQFNRHPTRKISERETTDSICNAINPLAFINKERIFVIFSNEADITMSMGSNDHFRMGENLFGYKVAPEVN
jgi:hypothetical protein